MQKASAIEHYGTEQAVADAIGVTRSAVNQWGALVPPLRAMQLQQSSGGKLVYDPAVYADWTKKFAGTRGTEGRAA